MLLASLQLLAAAVQLGVASTAGGVLTPGVAAAAALLLGVASPAAAFVPLLLGVASPAADSASGVQCRRQGCCRKLGTRAACDASSQTALQSVMQTRGQAAAGRAALPSGHAW